MAVTHTDNLNRNHSTNYHYNHTQHSYDDTHNHKQAYAPTTESTFTA